MKPNNLPSSAQKSLKQVVLMFVLALGVYACTTNQDGKLIVTPSNNNPVTRYNANPLTVQIPTGLSPKSIEKSMVLAVIGRGWTLQSNSHDEVIASLKNHVYNVTVMLQSDGAVIRILVDATRTIANASNDNESKPSVPRGWLRNIQRDLKTNLVNELYQ